MTGLYDSQLVSSCDTSFARSNLITFFLRLNTAIGLRVYSIDGDGDPLKIASELEPLETSVKTEPTNKRHV